MPLHADLWLPNEVVPASCVCVRDVHPCASVYSACHIIELSVGADFKLKVLPIHNYFSRDFLR